MLTRLPHGTFFGRPRSRSEAGGFQLTQLEAGPAPVELHTHDTAHFILVQSGRYHSDADGGGKPDGGAVLIYNPPGTTHRDHFRPESGRYRGRFFSMAVDASRMHGIADLVPLATTARRIDDHRAIGIARRLAAECRTWGPTSPLVAEGLALELMAFAAVRRDHEPPTPPPWLCRARDALLDQCHAPISIGMVAAEIGVHPVHLARSFRRHFGCTPGDFLRRARLELGMRLLETTPRPISEIAFQAGFSDQSHFTRAFQRGYATTPGAFRRERSTVPS